MSKRSKKKLKKTPIILASLLIIGGATYYVLSNNGHFESFDKIFNKAKDIINVPEKKVEVVDVNSNTRPFAVMVNNVNAAWNYQAGLCDAYMEYTLLAEGGITRKMAVFKDVKDEDTKIMSIRSSRHYFIDYAMESDAIYVHWGWSPFAQNDIKKYKINNVNGLYYEGVYFSRDSEVRKHVSSEHTGYITIGNIAKAASNLKYRTTTETKTLLDYSIDPIDASKFEGVKDADHVEIKYSGYYTAKYDYNKETKSYSKKQNNTDMKDYNGTCDLMYKNIITYQIPYSNIVGDAKGRLDAKTVGSGKGYYITEGKAIPITWEKTSRESRTIYKYADGTPLKVNDGKTALELQPTNQKLTIEAIEEETTTTATK